MSIEIRHLEKTYGEQVIFNDFNLTIEKNKITGISGPSGAGKTTLLNMIAGLEKPDQGEITGIDAPKISYIFQEPRLLPWRTVRENLRFVLDRAATKRPGIHEEEIDTVLDLVELREVENFYPNELSGGMRQRVSIARALVYPATLMLMDEPFSSLDQKLKNQLMESFLKFWEKDQRTVVFVSHNEAEIRKLAHRILTFSQKPVRILKNDSIK